MGRIETPQVAKNWSKFYNKSKRMMPTNWLAILPPVATDCFILSETIRSQCWFVSSSLVPLESVFPAALKKRRLLTLTAFQICPAGPAMRSHRIIMVFALLAAGDCVCPLHLDGWLFSWWWLLCGCQWCRGCWWRSLLAPVLLQKWD